MDREILINTFDPTIEQRFKSSFQKLIKSRVADYNGLIQQLLELQGEGKLYILEKGLPQLFETISEDLGAQPTGDFSNTYLQVLSEVVQELPEEVVWSRKIPIRNEVEYILTDPALIIGVLREFCQRQLQFFISLEHLLAPKVKKGAQEQPSPDLSKLVSVTEKQVDFLENSFSQKLDEAVEQIQARVHISIEKKAANKRPKPRDPEQVRKEWEGLRQSLLNEEKQWSEPKGLQLERNKAILDFLQLKKVLQKESEHFLEDFGQSSRQLILRPLRKLHAQLKDAVAEINQIEIYDSRKKTDHARQQLLVSLDQLLEGPLSRAAGEEVFAQKTEAFFEKTLMQINKAPEQMSFIFNHSDHGPPLGDDLKQIEWRLLLARIFRKQLINGLKPANRQHGDFASEVPLEIEEIRDALDVNLTAPGDSDDPKMVPVEVFIKTLSRVIKRTDALISSVQQEIDHIAASVKNGQKAFFEEVITCLMADSASKLHPFTEKYEIKESTHDGQDVVDNQTQKSKGILKVWYRLVKIKAGIYGRKVKSFFGYGEPETTVSKRADILGYLSETERKLAELPTIYRRLFDYEAAAEPRFSVPVTDSSAAFKQAYQQWQSALSASFAIVGEKGSGKTTFLELAADELSGDKPLYRLSVEQTIRTEEDLLNLLCKDLDLPQAESTESMIKALKKEEDRRIVFLESIQNCFVRNINGYEAIQKLCYLISETRQHVFWIVSCSRYGWHFLDEVLSVNEYFSHMIRTDTLDPAKIEKLIMSRHEASGYLLRFEKKPDVKNKQTSEKLSQQEQQEKLRADYFQQLAKIADGNASIAILFWIRSIQSFDDSCFTIKPLETTSIEMVEELNPEVLFALAAVVIHDVITDEDLSMILNVSREESRLMLNRLSSRGLLLRNGEQHKLNHKVYRQIIRVLRERNIIHLV